MVFLCDGRAIYANGQRHEVAALRLTNASFCSVAGLDSDAVIGVEGVA